jgi:hypothetical protein
VKRQTGEKKMSPLPVLLTLTGNDESDLTGRKKKVNRNTIFRKVIRSKHWGTKAALVAAPGATLAILAIRDKQRKDKAKKKAKAARAAAAAAKSKQAAAQAAATANPTPETKAAAATATTQAAATTAATMTANKQEAEADAASNVPASDEQPGDEQPSDEQPGDEQQSNEQQSDEQQSDAETSGFYGNALTAPAINLKPGAKDTVMQKTGSPAIAFIAAHKIPIIVFSAAAIYGIYYTMKKKK